MARLPRRTIAVALLVASSGWLAGSYCSDRGYYTPGGTSTPGPRVAGAISRFGSVYVAGTEYATTSASITVDGVATGESALLVGQVATIVASGSGSNPSRAQSISVTTRLVGPASAADLAAHTVTVLGQTVQITGDTSVSDAIAPTEPFGLLAGQLLAVDGYRTSAGFIASRLDPATAGATLRVVGIVSGLDGFTQTFQVGGTTVSYAGVSAVPTNLANNRYVIASGLTTTGSATLNASQLQMADEATAGAAEAAATLHGAVTRYSSAGDFDVAGQAVASDASTTIVGSGTLGADVELEVAGRYDAAGVLHATTITFVPATPLRIVGPVDRIDEAAGTFAIAGVTLSTASTTRWDDRGALRSRTFVLAQLRTGDWVEARGVATGALAADARVVERRVAPASTAIVLEDDASAVADPTLNLAGIVVDTRGATFLSVTGTPLTRSAFFADVAGHAVRARGSLASGGALVATLLSLRD